MFMATARNGRSGMYLFQAPLLSFNSLVSLRMYSTAINKSPKPSSTGTRVLITTRQIPSTVSPDTIQPAPSPIVP